MHTTHAPFPTAAPHAKRQPTENAFLNWCLFWLPTLLILLVIVVPDFEPRHAQSAGGVEVESDLVATMATENSLRESAFLLSLLALGAAGAALFLFAGLSGGRPGSLHLWIIVATLAFAACSLMWSDDRWLTFRRLVITGCFVSGAWGIGRAWRPMQLVHMVLLLSALFAISGILAEIYYGTFMAAGGYRFSGFLHPNRQALSCGLLVLAAMTMKAKTGNHLYWLLAAIGLRTIGHDRLARWCRCLRDRSRLSVHRRRPFSPARSLGTCSAACSSVEGCCSWRSSPMEADDWKHSLRWDAAMHWPIPKSLTGRIPIWAEMTVGIQESPVVGHGYAAYWTPQRIHRLSYIHDWEFNNAHSSYLEIMLSLGLVGFTLGMTGVLSIFARRSTAQRSRCRFGVGFHSVGVCDGLDQRPDRVDLCVGGLRIFGMVDRCLHDRLLLQA